jgi:decaprenyl-phosphate phosphoribosyltransferase
VPAETATLERRAATATDESLALGLLRTARPKQWAKNVLVAAAPGAAGVIEEARPAALTILAFVVFCLATSGTYFVNDARDVEADRRHPVKRRRPVAAGAVPLSLAYTVGAILISAAVLTCVVAAQLELLGVVAIYVGLSVAYSVWLKHVAILDLAAVASGFVLRAIAGAVVVDVPVSDWFLIVASFGSLFMVAGKRYAELREMGAVPAAGSRPALAAYSLPFLRYVWALASAVAVTAYCLWAFEVAGDEGGFPWSKVSVLPFVVAILRYALEIDEGKGGETPEDVVLGDPALQLVGLAWLLTFALGVY